MLQSIRVGRPYVRPGDVGAIHMGFTIHPAGKESPHLNMGSGDVGAIRGGMDHLPGGQRIAPFDH
jgi:hypothetical protein